MVEIGLIGTGRHGSRYLNHITRDVPGANLQNILTSKPASMFDIDCEIHSELDPFLKSDIDLVIVVTPTGTHYDLARRSLLAGKHVLVEKPLCGYTDQCQKLISIAKENGVRLGVAQTLRYNPTILRLKEIMKDRRIKSIHMEQTLEPPYDGSWLYDDIAEGGILLNTGVHIFDTIRFLTGSDIEIVETEIKSFKNPRWEDHASGRFILENDVCGSFLISRIENTRTRMIDVETPSSRILADGMNEHILDNGEPISIEGEKRTIISILKHIVESFENDEPLPVQAFEGMKAVEACREAYEKSKLSKL